VTLKENSDDPETGRKIRNLLTPMEFTRLDGLVDVMFTTVADVDSTIIETSEDTTEAITPAGKEEIVVASSGWEFTDAAVLDQKRSEIIDALAHKIETKLIKKSRALFWDASHQKRVACSISKRYTKGSYPYWHAYHPEWNEFLREGASSYFVLGCMDLDVAFAIPLAVVAKNLDALNTTTTSKKTYWHVHFVETDSGGYALLLPHRGTQLPLNEFQIPIGQKAQPG
jgi:hypothetical protein